MNLHDLNELARTGTCIIIFLTTFARVCAEVHRHIKERASRRTQ